MGLETVNLDGIGLELKTVLGGQELLEILSLVTLQLNHLTHLRVRDDGAIASELLLDDLQNLLLVKLLGQTLNGSQSLAAIALLNSNVNVALSLFSLAGIFVGFGEGVEGLEVFDGHKLGLFEVNED